MIDYKKYTIWELGHEITLDIYKLTSRFPKEESYGLTSQMRRAAYSIPSNIVERCGRELEYFIILTRDLGYLDLNLSEKIQDKVNKTRRSINNLIHKI